LQQRNVLPPTPSVKESSGSKAAFFSRKNQVLLLVNEAAPDRVNFPDFSQHGNNTLCSKMSLGSKVRLSQ
jgi:hypothetical protein